MSSPVAAPADRAAWMAVVRPYQRADVHLAVGQLLNTFLPLALLFAASCLALQVQFALVLLLSLPLAGLLVRLFIIQHDCGHGSFLPSKRWNDRVGLLCSLFTFTPYAAWRRDHAVHHATAGNLDHRGTGDIRTLTVDEYTALSPGRRRLYRWYRHPLILFVLGPTVHFLVLQRIPWTGAAGAHGDRQSILLTNLALLLLYGTLAALLGWQRLLLVWLPPAALAASAGVWLFYVQHQFDEAYWVREPDWEYSAVALQGSSYYKLPKLFQWFTGNIGLHHVHHLSPRIPNYLLQRCHDENEVFQRAPVMTFVESLKTIPLALWHEQGQRLVSFRRAREMGLVGA